MKTEAIQNRHLLHSLAGVVCPACGKSKRIRQTFCLSEYRRLPKQFQQNLYRRVGDGYREAVIAALIFLKIESPHGMEIPPSKKW